VLPSGTISLSIGGPGQATTVSHGGQTITGNAGSDGQDGLYNEYSESTYSGQGGDGGTHSGGDGGANGSRGYGQSLWACESDGYGGGGIGAAYTGNTTRSSTGQSAADINGLSAALTQGNSTAVPFATAVGAGSSASTFGGGGAGGGGSGFFGGGGGGGSTTGGTLGGAGGAGVVVISFSGTEFSPLSISDLALWLDASDVYTLFRDAAATTPATDASDPVGAWRDKSGNNRHATQSTAGSRPTISATLQNGRKQVALTSTAGNALRVSSLVLSAPFSLLAVVRKDARAIATFACSTDQARLQFGDGSATFSGSFYGASKVGGAVYGSAPIVTGRHQVFAAVADSGTLPSSLSMFSDGIGGQAAVITAGTAPSNSIGGDFAVGGDGTGGWGGTVCEMIAYSKSLTLVERRRLEVYLANRWGITLAPTVSNADAQDWINRVYANGGTVSAATAAAVNAFCDAIDAAGIRDKFYRLNLHTGGTTGSAAGLAASLVPLYRGPSLGGTQYGSTIDAQSLVPFVAADYSTTDGLFAGLNTNKYLDTGLATNTLPQSVYQAMHLSAWHGNVAFPGGTDPCLIGAYNSSVDRNEIHISMRATPAADDARLGQVAQVFSVTQCSGTRYPASYIASRTSPTSLRLYRNGVFESETTTSVTSPGNSFPLWVHRRNATGTPSGEQIGLSIWAYSIGAGMTAQQVTDYYNAMTAFNTAMGRLFFVTPQVANADAQSWITRVYNNGGTVSSTTAAAVNDFCNAIDAAGIRDRFYRLNLFCGGTSGTSAGLAACLVPLYRGPAVGGTQYGGYIDTNSNFAVGDYAETGATGGLAGNGTSKYLATGLNPYDAGLSETDFHTSGYFRETQNTSGAFIGCVNSSAQRGVVFHPAYLTFGMYVRFGGLTDSGIENGTLSSRNGHLLGVRRPGGAGFKDGANINATSVTTGSVAWAASADSPSLYVFARNDVTASPSIAHYAGRSQAYSIGKGMTDAQAAAYYTAMQAFQTALSRNV
jgi:hypothetical protein